MGAPPTGPGDDLGVASYPTRTVALHGPVRPRGYGLRVSTTPGLNAAESADLCRELLGGFDAAVTGEFLGRLDVYGRRVSTAFAPFIWSLTAHAHHLGRRALDDLSADDGVLLAAPLVRGALEAAVTAQWVVRMPTGLEGFLAESLRQTENLGKTYLKVRPVGQTVRLSDAAMDYLANRPPVTTRNFENICDDLAPDGPLAYLLYRTLSGLCHVGGHVVEQYVARNDVSDSHHDLRLVARPTPDDHAQALSLRVLATSFLWAGAALDSIDRKHQRRAALTAAGKRLYTEPYLKLSASAWVRENDPANRRSAKAREQSRRRAQSSAINAGIAERDETE